MTPARAEWGRRRAIARLVYAANTAALRHAAYRRARLVYATLALATLAAVSAACLLSVWSRMLTASASIG